MRSLEMMASAWAAPSEILWHANLFPILFRLTSQCGLNAGIEVTNYKVDAAAARIVRALGRFRDAGFALEIVPAGLVWAGVGDQLRARSGERVVDAHALSHLQSVAGDENVHRDGELLTLDVLGNVFRLFQREVRAAEHGEVDLAAVRELIAELFFKVAQVLVGDDDLALGLLAAEGRFQRGRFGREAENVVHAVSPGGVELCAEVTQRLGRDDLRQVREDGDALADLVAHHAEQMVFIVALHVGFHADKDVALAVFIEQQTVFGHAAGDGGAQCAVGALAVGARAPDGVDIRRGARFGESADLAEVRHVRRDVRRAVIAQHRAERAVGIVRAQHVGDVLGVRRMGAGAGEVTGAEAGVDRRGHAAVRADLDQLFGKPQVAGLIAQGNVRTLDGHHALGVEAFADADLDLHGIGGAFAVLAVQHGLLFVSQDHDYTFSFIQLKVQYLLSEASHL